MSKITTESADMDVDIDIKSIIDKPFIGKYNSTWSEDNNIEIYTLNITEKANTEGRILSLKWIKKGILKVEPVFYGEGFIHNNVLIGNYWDEEIAEIKDHYNASMAWTLKVDAEEKVKKERSLEIAKGMLTKNIDIETIIELTGLTKEEISQLSFS